MAVYNRIFSRKRCGVDFWLIGVRRLNPCDRFVSVRRRRVNEAYQKAEILVEALSWIRQFKDRSVVIKLGGSALEDEATVRRLLKDVIFMEAV